MESVNEIKELYKNFKELVCFKNAICTISSNTIINLTLFNNYYGGQLTNTLPGKRLIKTINGERYSFIIYGTGKIVLTNLYYMNDMNSVYNYFNNLILSCIKYKIAVVMGDTLGVKKLKIVYLIENFQFSFHIDTPIFMMSYQMFISKCDAAALLENIKCTHRLANHIYNVIISKYNICTFDYEISKERFPADMITFYIWRTTNILYNNKSVASRKRKKNNFDKQTCSIHIFRNGKFILTGVQTKTDMCVVKEIMISIVKFFFSQLQERAI